MSKSDEILDAVKYGDLEVVERLLSGDASLVHVRDEDSGATPLHCATVRGHRKIAELLIARGAEVNAKDWTWNATPKGWAVEYLLEHGALLGVQMDDFILAVKTGQVKWVRRWLQRNQHYARSCDAEGSAIEHAERSDNQDIIDLIEAAL